MSTGLDAVKAWGLTELRKFLYKTGRFSKAELKRMNAGELRDLAAGEIEE